jgi:cyclopropane fatty-acyl-phospholipid synthase-like methyltransferase
MTHQDLDTVGRSLGREWDTRAVQDARHYIATGESTGLQFSLSGLRDASLILEDIHEFLSADMRILEIGCGIGRLLRFMSVLFEDVNGIDASAEMIERAQEYLADYPRAKAFHGTGASLAVFEDKSFDLCYSYVVFQHIPSKEVIRNYFREACRILKPGGLFKFHVKTGVWEGQVEHDSWCGVELTMDDLDEWRTEMGFELVNAYSQDESTAWVIGRMPGA